MERQPLVLLPGLLNDAELWRHQIDTLADVADISVGNLDHDDSLAGLAKRVLAAAPGRFALAGLSMGGYVAQEVMRQAPERVLRLALLDTNARADGPEAMERRLRLIDIAESGRFSQVMPGMVGNLVHPRRLGSDDFVGMILTMAERVGPKAFVRQQRAIMGRPDGRDDLRRIACPTLVLFGRQDTLTPIELHLEMAAAIPGARFVVIEDAAHLTPVEQPQAISAVLRYWLQG